MLFGVGFLIFGNGLNGRFVRDDNIVLSHSLFNTQWSFLKFFDQPYFEDMPGAGLYRPLTQISFAFNFLFSVKPLGFHLVNILLHIVNSYLVYCILRRWSSGGRLAILASLLFLIVPIHVEVVTSIVGRAELLSFFFSLLAFLKWHDFKYLTSTILLLLALLSKEGAIALPAVVFVLSLFYKRDLKWLYYHLAGVIVFFILRVVVLGKYAIAAHIEYIFNPLAYSSFTERVFTSFKTLTLYLQKIFIPYNLTADYSYNQIAVVKNLLTSPVAIVGLVIFLGAIYFSFRFLKTKQHRAVFVAIVIFVLFYLPVSNLILPIGTIMGDRLMYFPSLGVMMLIAIIMERLSSKKTVIYLVTAPVVLYWGAMTVRQNAVWKNEHVLHEDMYRKSPDSVVAKTQWGIEMLNHDKELAKKLGREAYGAYPDNVQNLNFLGTVSVLEKDLSGAEKFLVRALELHPHHVNTMLNLSRVYFSQNKYSEAEVLLAEINSRTSGEGNIIFYAVVKIKIRKYQEAIVIVNQYFGDDTTDGSALTVTNYAKWGLGLPINQEAAMLEQEFKELANSFTYPQ